MRPSLLHELLADDPFLNSFGVYGDRIKESQSIDSRPFEEGYFITISGDEVLFSSVSVLERGPRTFVVAIHRNADETRDYTDIDLMLARVALIYKEIANVSGTDGVRVTKVRARGRSGNLVDEGWNTITRNATFGVLYQE